VVATDFSRSTIDRDYMLLTTLPGVPLSTAASGRTATDRALQEVGGYLCTP